MSESPYHFSGNNPVIFVDPNGMDYWSTNDPNLIASFLFGLKSGWTAFDFSAWNHATDAEFTGNLTYNDETNRYYTYYGTEIKGVATVIGCSFEAVFVPTVNSMPYEGAFVREPLSGFWQNAGYYTGFGGYDTYAGIVGEWNVSREGRLVGISTIKGIAPSAGMGGAAGQIRSTTQKVNFLKQFAQSPKCPRWMKQWLSAGKVPPGYNVEHIKPLSIGGADLPSNM